MVRLFKSKIFNSKTFRKNAVSDRVADFRANAFSSARKRSSTAARSVRRPSFVRQLKALVASKRKDAADVARNVNPQSTTSIACLSSSTGFATAASGTGLLNLDGDECLINSVRIRGSLDNQGQIDVDRSSAVEQHIRQLIVWFNKPLLVASAAGTLPPITEVLVTDNIEALPVPANANGGRFVILSDRYFNMGTNTFAATTAVGAPAVNGTNYRIVDYTVKVNKMCKFKANSVSGTPAGHYDSDVSPGQIDRGLLVMYTQVNTDGSATPNLLVTMNTRLNYTG